MVWLSTSNNVVITAVTIFILVFSLVKVLVVSPGNRSHYSPFGRATLAGIHYGSLYWLCVTWFGSYQTGPVSLAPRPFSLLLPGTT